MFSLPNAVSPIPQILRVRDIRHQVKDLGAVFEYLLNLLDDREFDEEGNRLTLKPKTRANLHVFSDSGALLFAIDVRNELTHPDQRKVRTEAEVIRARDKFHRAIYQDLLPKVPPDIRSAILTDPHSHDPIQCASEILATPDATTRVAFLRQALESHLARYDAANGLPQYPLGQEDFPATAHRLRRHKSLFSDLNLKEVENAIALADRIATDPHIDVPYSVLRDASHWLTQALQRIERSHSENKEPAAIPPSDSGAGLADTSISVSNGANMFTVETPIWTALTLRVRTCLLIGLAVAGVVAFALLATSLIQPSLFHRTTDTLSNEQREATETVQSRPRNPDKSQRFEQLKEEARVEYAVDQLLRMVEEIEAAISEVVAFSDACRTMRKPESELGPKIASHPELLRQFDELERHYEQRVLKTVKTLDNYRNRVNQFVTELKGVAPSKDASRTVKSLLESISPELEKTVAGVSTDFRSANAAMNAMITRAHRLTMPDPGTPLSEAIADLRGEAARLLARQSKRIDDEFEAKRNEQLLQAKQERARLAEIALSARTRELLWFIFNPSFGRKYFSHSSGAAFQNKTVFDGFFRDEYRVKNPVLNTMTGGIIEDFPKWTDHELQEYRRLDTLAQSEFNLSLWDLFRTVMRSTRARSLVVMSIEETKSVAKSERVAADWLSKGAPLPDPDLP